MYPNVRASQGGNRDLYLTSDREQWIAAMVWQINEISERKAKKGKQGAGHHRWFAAGDIVDRDMSLAIMEVARRTPHIKHWLVTREGAFVKGIVTPSNLVLRVSSAMIDGKPRPGFKHTCTVHKSQEPIGFVCPAMANNGECGSCTACWNPEIPNVSYKFH